MIFKSRHNIIANIILFLPFFIFGLQGITYGFKVRSGGGSSGFRLVNGIKLPNKKITIEGNDIPLRPLIIGICHEFRLNYVLNSSVNGNVTLHIRHIPLPDALSIILRAGNLGYSVNNGILFIGPRASLKNSYVDYKIDLKYIQAKNILPDLTPILPTGAKAYASPHGNSIFVYDIPSNIKKIKRIIKKIDVKKRVVLLNARIVDVTNNFVRNLGIAWSFSPNRNNTLISTSTFPTGFSGTTTSTAGSNTLNVSVGTAWQNFGIISAQLSLGQQLGWDKVIASPSVSVISGQPATINSGVTLYYVAYTASGGSSSSAPSSGTGTTVITQEPVTSSLQTITLGLTLTVTPIVESKNSIMLNINVTNSQPDFGQQVNGFPSVNNKSVTTTVMVKNNSTLVIGGILYTDKSHSNNGIPILSQIPVLGYLFSSRNRQVSKEQLMIFISPKIVN
ncbi:MAG: secretin N-terminal domain-containing protein [bacterium]